MEGERISWGRGERRMVGRWDWRVLRVLPSLTLRSLSGGFWSGSAEEGKDSGGWEWKFTAGWAGTVVERGRGWCGSWDGGCGCGCGGEVEGCWSCLPVVGAAGAVHGVDAHVDRRARALDGVDIDGWIWQSDIIVLDR